MAEFRITPRARDDLKNIGRYTLKLWGREQRNNYLRQLDSRFLFLAQNPQLGKHRPDIHQDYHCFAQGSHLVFYILRPGGIDIIGIPHRSMDIQGFFNK